MPTEKEYKIIIRYLEKYSKYIAKIIYKKADPAPIGIIVPRYREFQDEALAEADQWFTGENELELWSADMLADDPDPTQEENDDVQ